jgi:photosystem II stability/assembly factor-like uncharacterized protein
MCWRRDRKGFQSLGKKYSPPGSIEFTISELLPLTASWLEKIKCAFTLYALETTCDVGLFKGWQRAFIVPGTELMDDTISGLAKHGEDTEITHEFSLSGDPPRIDAMAVTASRLDTTEAEGLKFIQDCGILSCGDDCGAYGLPCDKLLVGAAGDPAAANVLKSLNGGDTFAATAAKPFPSAALASVVSGACFKISQTVTRYLVVRTTVAATVLQAAYSDDGGTTWTLVNVGTATAEGCLGPRSLFVLDYEHIWVCTDDGNVFFSSDGGESWTDQNALGATSAAALHAIDFADENIGFAVGATDVVIKTIDGGAHWTLSTATGSADTLQAVVCFNKNRVLIGTNSLTGGSLWMSYDGGLTYTQKTFTGHALEQVKDINFINDFVGMMVTNTTAPLGSLHVTIDGGHIWEKVAVPANTGLNSVQMCDINKAYAVGEPQAATGMILAIG